MGHHRYRVSKNSTDAYWSIVDLFTGWAAVYHGVRLDTLEAEEAVRIVDIANLADLSKRGKLNPLR
jgi:hypothetical protein